MRIRASSRLHGHGRLLATFACAWIGGWLFHAASVPLAWILGPMSGSAIFANISGTPGETKYVRRAGQLLVGSATGAVLSHEVLGQLLGFMPVMLAAALAANLASVALSFLFARMARIDRTTAILSTLPAGLSAMAPLAMEIDARSDVVTVAHTVRVVLVVLFIPFYFGFLGQAGAPEAAAPGATYSALVVCIAISTLVAWIAARAGLLNPWVIAPMLIAIVLVLCGWPLQTMPHAIQILAQVFIGLSLGARLKAADLLRLPRAAAASLICAGLLVAFVVFAVVPVLHIVTHLAPESLGMGVAPGGLGEMIAAAKALGVGSAIVTGFQFSRSFMTNVLAPPLILRLRGLDRADTSS